MKTTSLEHQVMTAILMGDYPALAILRKQYEVATISKRDVDTDGFVTDFSIPDSVERISGQPSFVIRDVYGDFQGMEYGVAFILFVRNGAIAFLEATVCNAADDSYPMQPSLQKLFYLFTYRGWLPHTTKLGRMFMPKPRIVEKKERDWKDLKKVLKGN